MALNLHRVFENGTSYGSYHSAITVARTQEDDLRAARDDIRSALRGGLRNWERVVEKGVLFDSAVVSIDLPALQPRFRMQGSFSYRTQVEPPYLPPQQIDLDDGLFLPVSFLTNDGARHPIVASKGLFEAVERVLRELCTEKGWRLGDEKDSCVRVEISDTSHVDVALYAIPDAQFAQLVEEAAYVQLQKGLDDRAASIRDDIEFDEDLYRRISASEIMLAHRREGWKPSDPRKLDTWFQGAVNTHGQQLRRVCKYLKGWRDFTWEGCRLSSIALMAGAVSAYDSDPAAFHESRDDLALLIVARTLAGFLSSRIDNPVVQGQRLDEGWLPEQRNEYVAAASKMASQMFRAIERASSPSAAIAELRTAFGDRIPDAVDLVAVVAASTPAVPIAHRDREEAAAAAVNSVRESGSATRPWAKP